MKCGIIIFEIFVCSCTSRVDLYNLMVVLTYLLLTKALATIVAFYSLVPTYGSPLKFYFEKITSQKQRLKTDNFVFRLHYLEASIFLMQMTQSR